MENERVEKLEHNLSRLIDIVSTLAQVAMTHQEKLDKVSASQTETDEQLGIILKMVDDWIRNNPGSPRNQKTPASE